MVKKNFKWILATTLISILTIILLGLGINSLVVHSRISTEEKIAVNYINKNFSDRSDGVCTYLGHTDKTYLFYYHFDDGSYVFVDVTNNKAKILDS